MFDAARFSHKVFAQLDAFQSDHRYVVWLDADVVIKKPITREWLIGLLDGKMCAYLGRQQSYTETGFIVFDTQHPDFREFEQRYYFWYASGMIFLLRFWIDCTVFDASIDGLDCKNLTPNAQGMMDVFSQCELKEYMDHDKGMRKHRRPNEPLHEAV